MNNKHRKRIPPKSRRDLYLGPPQQQKFSQWVQAKLIANKAGCQLHLIYNAKDFNALEQGLAGLSNILYIKGIDEQKTMVGIGAIEDELANGAHSKTAQYVRWMFMMQWEQPHSAWNALHYTLTHRNYPAFAIHPKHLLPTLFLTYIADQAETSRAHLISTYGPLLAETCSILDPLLFALYKSWIEGPSHTAMLYRQYTEHIPTESTCYQPFLDGFAQLVGSEEVQAIRNAECLESAVLYLFDKISIRLWNAPRETSPSFAVILQAHHFLSGLLPLALWNPLNRPISVIGEQASSLRCLEWYWRQGL